MKLYATTTSERATKGQGGNDYLSIDVQNEDKESILTIKIEKGFMYSIKGQIYQMTIKNLIDGTISRTIIKKLQQAKICYCSDTELSIPHYSDDHKEELKANKKKKRS